MNDLLIVEDDPALQGLLRQILERENIPFRMAGDGKEALALARLQPPAAILLDMELPDEPASGESLDGFGVWERLTGMAVGRPPRVIVFSSGNSDMLRQAQQRGAFAVFRKSVLATKLMAALRRALAGPGVNG